MMEAIVLAGGRGTRLRPVVEGIPKPMAPVSGKPFLAYVLGWLAQNGISRVILSVGYRWEVIFAAFGTRFQGMELVYSVEDTPLGTGGAIALAMGRLRGDPFFIVNGDTFFDVSLGGLLLFHQSFDLSILLKPMKNFDRYGTVTVNAQNRIVAFHEKAPREDGLINGGIYLANRRIEDHFPAESPFSFEKAFLEKNVHALTFGGLVSDRYFIDIGIPADYLRAQSGLRESL
ncbi:MAG: nucleotidyltransferase family protein [Mangrovibacterium sp.]|nr:nucleotidyltransferase family protein [Mangrovibacterium sp.]